MSKRVAWAKPPRSADQGTLTRKGVHYRQRIKEAVLALREGDDKDVNLAVGHLIAALKGAWVFHDKAKERIRRLEVENGKLKAALAKCQS